MSSNKQKPLAPFSPAKLLTIPAPLFQTALKKHQTQQPKLRPSTAPALSPRRIISVTPKWTGKQPQPRTPKKSTRPATASNNNNNKQLNIVLPPRRFSSLSSSCLTESSSNIKVTTADPVYEQVPDVTIRSLHFSSTYTPHKEYWIVNALEKLGNTWIKENRISYNELVSAAFEEKMGALYDLAMARKHESIDMLISEIETEGKEHRTANNKKSSSKRNDRGDRVQDKFPFASHVSDTIKKSMSSLLLGIMQGNEAAETGKGCKKREDYVNEGKHKKQEGDEVNKTVKKPENKNNKNDSLSSVGSINRGSLIPCYILDGRLVVGDDRLIGAGGSIVNQFWDTGKSRIRKQQDATTTYFRKSANMMGFYPHEITIRYCKKSHRIVVSGARPQRNDGENARQVREILQVPRSIRVRDLVAMRTAKGSLLFEQVEKDT